LPVGCPVDSGNLAIKLLRTYKALLEAFQRYRGNGQQKVTVEQCMCRGAAKRYRPSRCWRRAI
jgi:hypothetical protein